MFPGRRVPNYCVNDNKLCIFEIHPLQLAPASAMPRGSFTSVLYTPIAFALLVGLFSYLLSNTVRQRSLSADSSDTEPSTPDSIVYDEDTMVSLWTRIHDIRIKLGIIDPMYIKYPPPGGHQIDYSLVSGVGIDARVRQFLKLIPHLSDEHFTDFGQKLVHTTDLASYLSARDVAMSRDANRFSFNFKDIDTLDLTNLRPSDVVLSHDEEGEGFWMILDTQESKSRSYKRSSPQLTVARHDTLPEHARSA